MPHVPASAKGSGLSTGSFAVSGWSHGSYGRGMDCGPPPGAAAALQGDDVWQGASFAAPIPDVVVAFDAGCRKEAIAYAKAQRERGVSVAMMYGMSAEELRHRVEYQLAQSAVYITDKGIQQYGKAVF